MPLTSYLCIEVSGDDDFFCHVTQDQDVSSELLVEFLPFYLVCSVYLSGDVYDGYGVDYDSYCSEVWGRRSFGD